MKIGGRLPSLSFRGRIHNTLELVKPSVRISKTLYRPLKQYPVFLSAENTSLQLTMRRVSKAIGDWRLNGCREGRIGSGRA